MIATLPTPRCFGGETYTERGGILGHVDKVVFAIPHSVGYRCDRKLVAH